MSPTRAGGTAPAAAIALALLMLGGCTSAPTPAAMKAVRAPSVTVVKKAPGGVIVDTRGGTDTSTLGGIGISNADLKSAIDASLADAAIFDDKGGSPNRYALTAVVANFVKPTFGASFTVDLEIGWTLIDTQTGTTMLRKPILSTHTATMSDAMAGVTRIRLAVEGAVRKNVEMAVQELARLNY